MKISEILGRFFRWLVSLVIFATMIYSVWTLLLGDPGLFHGHWETFFKVVGGITLFLLAQVVLAIIWVLIITPVWKGLRGVPNAVSPAGEDGKTEAFEEKYAAEEARLKLHLWTDITRFVALTTVTVLLLNTPQHIIEKYMIYGVRLIEMIGGLFLVVCTIGLGIHLLEYCTKNGRRRIVMAKLGLAPKPIPYREPDY